jgi:hypothetical protein
VSGVPWRIITGSELDYNCSYLQSLITAPNQWLCKTRSIPSWTTSVFSSTVADLHEWRLSYEWRSADDSSTTESRRLSLSLILLPTVSRPVCLGIKHLSEAYDQIFITVRELRFCWCGALSLTRGRVSRLQLLLVLASAVFFWSSLTNPFITWCGPQREHPVERFVCRNLRIRWQGNACLPNRCWATVYSGLPRNGRSLRLHHSGFQAFWHIHCHGNVLSKALPSNGLFRLSGIMSHTPYTSFVHMHWVIYFQHFCEYFTVLSAARLYNVGWQDERWKMKFKGFGRSPSLIDILSWYLFGGTEETRPTFEPNTFLYTNPLWKGHIFVSRNPAFAKCIIWDFAVYCRQGIIVGKLNHIAPQSIVLVLRFARSNHVSNKSYWPYWDLYSALDISTISICIL